VSVRKTPLAWALENGHSDKQRPRIKQPTKAIRRMAVFLLALAVGLPVQACTVLKVFIGIVLSVLRALLENCG